MTNRHETLCRVLSDVFEERITDADYTETPLSGGTVGDVQLISGTAKTTDNRNLNFRLVLKTQRKWERDGDPLSWRREYDLYSSDLGKDFSESFRWPRCYRAELDTAGNQTWIWMEYVEGTTGLDLTGEMYERAAYELGLFQGALYREPASLSGEITNLSDAGFPEEFYRRYRSWEVVYDYIRSSTCEITAHLCDMIVSIDDQAHELFRNIETLPRVLCHRDFWVANIFYSEGNIRLIDWDTTGWGYLGEDVASLVADESDVSCMVELYKRCVPAYMKGFSEQTGFPEVKDDYVWERIVLMYGYRLVEWFLDADSSSERDQQIAVLQKVYEIGQVAGKIL